MRYEIFRLKVFAGATFQDPSVRRLPFNSFHLDDADDAADAATHCAAAGPAPAASGAVACAASAAVAWAASAAASSGEAGRRAHGASRNANTHPKGHGEARGQAITLGICCPYAAQGGPSLPEGRVGQGDGSRTEEVSQRGGCGGDAPSTLKFFGVQSLFRRCQESKC